MPGEESADFGFAPAEDAPIAYIGRIRDYYRTLGYAKPYLWAHYAEVPFQALGRPLSQCRVALITTAAPYRPDAGDRARARPTTPRRSSTRSGPATARKSTTCASPTSPSTATTPPPRTRAAIFRWPRCAAPRRPAASAP